MGRPGPETRLIAAIRKRIRETAKYRDSVLVVKYHGSQFGEAGVSDLLCCIGGVFVAVEVKAPEGRHPVTVKQRAFGQRVIEAGGYFAVVRSVDEFLKVVDTALDFGLNRPDPANFTWD